MLERAIEKIDSEMKGFKGGNKETAVKTAVAAALKEFARQDGEFAQAVVQNDKTLSDCCAAVMKNVGSSISDNEVFKRAAQFYFPGADVRFQMTIELCPATVADEGAPVKSAIVLDLADFLS